MEKKEFNLLNEPWIRVARPDRTENLVSLKSVFRHAHEYEDLSGELPAQDIAMLRFLLAILHTVFSRVDETGADAPLEEAEDAYERWRALWELRRFPERPILDYLERWRDRFYLFHPTHPFWQVPAAEIGTEYKAAKLNGEVAKSGNKERLFLAVSGMDMYRLEFPDAARWLLFWNAYDDSSVKPKKKKVDNNAPKPGVGWLGKLGMIALQGNTLFETLMLNLVLLKDYDDKEPWEIGCPAWELDSPRSSERSLVTPPESQAELLTLQSRRILLQRDGNYVVGHHALWGDFFDAKDVFSEQMTMWQSVEKKRGKGTVVDGFLPKPHDRSRRIWQDFASLMTKANADKDGDDKHTPGVITWLWRLIGEDCLPESEYVRIRIVSVSYDDKKSSIVDSFEDSLTFHRNLLSALGEVWVHSIENEVRQCETLSGFIADLALSLHFAEVGKKQGASAKIEEQTVRTKAKEQFFYRVDVPFRDWLRSLDPSQGDSVRLERQREWRDRVRAIAWDLGKELVSQAGPTAFRGRLVKKDEKDSGFFYSAPKAYNSFQVRLNKWYRGKSA